jgi:hypothetical protein
MVCAVYRSRRSPETYLFVDHHEGFARVPDALQQEFGVAERAMTFALHPARKLARADAAEVLRAIAERGYYLQLPPVAGVEPGKGSVTC